MLTYLNIIMPFNAGIIYCLYFISAQCNDSTLSVIYITMKIEMYDRYVNIILCVEKTNISAIYNVSIVCAILFILK